MGHLCTVCRGWPTSLGERGILSSLTIHDATSTEVAGMQPNTDVLPVTT
jgi:hypothetical protein